MLTLNYCLNFAITKPKKKYRFWSFFYSQNQKNKAMKKQVKKLENLDSSKFQKLESNQSKQAQGGISFNGNETYVAINGDNYRGCDNGCSGGTYTFY